MECSRWKFAKRALFGVLGSDPSFLSRDVSLCTLGQLAVRLMHSDFLGIKTATSALKEMKGEQVQRSSEEGIVFGVVVTSPTYEEYIREQPLQGDELLIVSEKPAIRDLCDAMLECELLQELETTVDAGLYGALPLCRLRFPHRVEQA
jgi:hypothetical protein